MKKSSLTLALAFAAITFSLAVRAQAQTVTSLAQFDGKNGNGPSGSVVQAIDGNFYGATAFGALRAGGIQGSERWLHHRVGSGRRDYW